ncbi:MAG: SDR family oxidoreductase [Acidobacteria bacterium]|nr:SDR family oxidoreductase [Acidobacteriota bacterium]
MQGFLHGKTAVVTGGARGIGRATVEALLREGAQVAFCARTPESVKQALDELAPKDKVMGQAADVRDVAAVDQFLEAVDQKFGGIDILINNAGIGVFQPAADLAWEEWRRVIDTNLSAVFYFCRSCLGRFRQRGGGQIVNVSSLAGRNPFAGGTAYNASKFGLNGFTEALMLDHRQENVRVSLICPGSVDTEFSPRGRSMDSSWKIAPEDVAEAVIGVLRMPARTLVSLVELRPAKPPQK